MTFSHFKVLKVVVLRINIIISSDHGIYFAPFSIYRIPCLNTYLVQFGSQQSWIGNVFIIHLIQFFTLVFSPLCWCYPYPNSVRGLVSANPFQMWTWRELIPFGWALGFLAMWGVSVDYLKNVSSTQFDSKKSKVF